MEKNAQMIKKHILVIATTNKGKVAEIEGLLKDFPVEIKNLGDFGPIPPVVEDGETFDDNAYKKSSQTARVLGFATLADDSGLVVDALDGAPGVHSARYAELSGDGGAGGGSRDSENCKKLLQEMENVEDRAARFKCVVSIAVPTGPALTYEASCEGVIAHAPSGENGFGYDPVFFCPEYDKTFAELSMEEKSRVSHRGKALAEMKNEFQKVIVWLDQNMPKMVRSGCMGEPANSTDGIDIKNQM